MKISTVVAAVEAKLKAAAQKVGAELDVPEDKIEAVLAKVAAELKSGAGNQIDPTAKNVPDDSDILEP
jgi:hypothetical protein